VKRPRFFATPAAFRRWLERHHDSETELWVGFHKRATGKPSLTWPQSVDEALCFGWIDGLRKRLDDESYVIRFTPRQAKSTWSAVNLRRMEELLAEGRVAPAGRDAHARRTAERTGIYSYEQRHTARFDPELEKRLRADPDAWSYFQAQAPWYRRTATFWVMSAKREATRSRRLDQLLAACAAGRAIPPLEQLNRKAGPAR